MDNIDKKIVSMLQDDGRASCDKISTVVGLSVSAVNERIKKLQKQGVILGFGAQVSPEKVGLDVLSFVKILLDEKCDEKRFLKEIAKVAEILECHHITGEWSYLIKIRCKNIHHFELVLGKKIKSIPGILRTHTLIALSSPFREVYAAF